MVVGVCTKVLDVLVPSYVSVSYMRQPVEQSAITYIFDLFHRKVRICRHAHILRLHVYDDQQRVRRVSLEQIVDLQVACSQLRPRVIPSYQLLPRVDLLEHVVHALDIVVVKKPDGWILVVLLKRNCLRLSAACPISLSVATPSRTSKAV